MKKITLILFAACFVAFTGCKKEGCTDESAINYSSEATKDDGSCEYETEIQTDTTTTSTTSTSTSDFYLNSDAIDSNGELLAAYKCETKVNGIEESIPLNWGNVPEGTGSIAIMMQHFPNSADTENANCYLLLWDIDPSITSIAHGAADDGAWFMGSDKDGTYVSYTSPCSQDVGTHAYEIIIYALDQTPSSLPQQSSLSVDRTTFLNAISTVTIVDQATLEFNDVN